MQIVIIIGLVCNRNHNKFFTVTVIITVVNIFTATVIIHNCNRIWNDVIEGSTDRCCIAIVTNERVLLSGSDQPLQNLGRHRIYACKAGKQTFKDRHIWSMVYGVLLMSATDTN